MRNDGTLNRRAVAVTLLRNPGEMLVVTGLGAPTYDAAAAGDRRAEFLPVGGDGRGGDGRPRPRARRSLPAACWC